MSWVGADRETRTLTANGLRILSPLRLPISPYLHHLGLHLHQLIIYCQPSILLHRYLDVDTPPPEKMAYI